MDKQDARSLKKDAQQLLRDQAIRLREGGKTYDEIAALLGVHRGSVCRWYKLYEREGPAGVRIQRRGRPLGSHRSLDAGQEAALRKMLTDKTPDQLKLPFALWTQRAVIELIHHLWGLEMPRRTVGEYLKRWGFTPQKPLKRAYEQQPQSVQKWLKEEYPGIAARAKAEGAEIHWGDETGLRSDSQHGRSYAPRGQTPVIRLSAKRESINLISTVTNLGKVRFMIYQETMNADVLIQFLRRLIKDAGRKIFLVLDNLRVHHSKKVKAWLAEESVAQKIEVFYLPSYSPELNPDEYLNCDLKAGVHSGPPARSKEDLRKKTYNHLRMVQRRPERVRKYFKHPRIAYAA